MAAARFARLQELLQPDIDALPDLCQEPESDQDQAPRSDNTHAGATRDRSPSQQEPPAPHVSEELDHNDSHVIDELDIENSDQDHATQFDSGHIEEIDDYNEEDDPDIIRDDHLPVFVNPEPEGEEYFSDAQDSEVDLDISVKQVFPAHTFEFTKASEEDEKNLAQDHAEMQSHTTNGTMKVGQLTPCGERFCPILALSKFPYKFVQYADSEAVSGQFFAGGQFWARRWDL